MRVHVDVDVEVGAAVGDEIQAAVEQLAALEAGGGRNPVDGFQRRIDLELIGRDLLGAQGARVGGFGGQAADVVEQAADLAQGAIGRGDDLIGPLRVGDGRADAGDVAAE